MLFPFVVIGNMLLGNDLGNLKIYSKVKGT
jgi:hypothetical protein